MIDPNLTEGIYGFITLFVLTIMAFTLFYWGYLATKDISEV